MSRFEDVEATEKWRSGDFFWSFSNESGDSLRFHPWTSGVRKHSTAMKSSKTKSGFDSFWRLVVVENEELTNSFQAVRAPNRWNVMPCDFKNSQPRCNRVWGHSRFIPKLLVARLGFGKDVKLIWWIWWKMPRKISLLQRNGIRYIRYTLMKPKLIDFGSSLRFFQGEHPKTSWNVAPRSFQTPFWGST